MSRPSIEIRPYSPADLPALEELALEIVHDGSVFPFEDVAGVMAYWLSPGAELFVACREGRVAGSYVLKPNQPDRGAHVANAGYMVGNAQRRMGLGEQLGRHSLEQARAAGYLAMQFNFVVASNESAIRLWKRLGFRVLATVPEAFRHPQEGLVDALIMHRSL